MGNLIKMLINTTVTKYIDALGTKIGKIAQALEQQNHIVKNDHTLQGLKAKTRELIKTTNELSSLVHNNQQFMTVIVELQLILHYKAALEGALGDIKETREVIISDFVDAGHCFL